MTAKQIDPIADEWIKGNASVRASIQHKLKTAKALGALLDAISRKTLSA